MIEWHLSKLEGQMVSVQRRLQAALDVCNDPTHNAHFQWGFMRSAIEGAIHDIGFTLELHGEENKATQEALL